MDDPLVIIGKLAFDALLSKKLECVGAMLDRHIRQKVQNHMHCFRSLKEHFKFQ